MMLMLTTALASLAIVAQDATTLRAAPRDSAQQQAQLGQGDALEVRGARMDYLQVYDHRRERAGYVKASQVRTIGTDAAAAPDLLAVLRFLQHTPGSEALGVAYAAAYLKAVPAQDLTAQPFDALGTLADRLARRASARQGKASDAAVAAQLDGVAAYGVRIFSVEREGQVQLCYDGDAYRRVLAMPSATPEQQARAVLALSRNDCQNPAASPAEREARTRSQADLLNSLPASAQRDLPDTLKNRLSLRRATVLSQLAFDQARHGQSSQATGQAALAALASVNKSELTDDDQAAYNDAAIRSGASRWAAELPGTAKAANGTRPVLQTVPGEPGETCVLLTDAKHPAPQGLLRRCTWGVPWLASATGNAAGTAFSIAVQPLATWRELWVMHQSAQGWQLDVLPPAPGNPLGEDAGYIEFAGWVPDAQNHVLMARESRTEGKYQRRFEVAPLATLVADKQASQVQLLAQFQRWQSPAWKQQTVILR